MELTSILLEGVYACTKNAIFAQQKLVIPKSEPRTYTLLQADIIHEADCI